MAEPTQERVKILEFNKLQMFTPCPSAPGKRSKLAFSSYMENPRITVFTNDPNDSVQNGIISAPMDPQTFFIFCDLLTGIIRNKAEDKNKVDCKTMKYINDKPSDERILVSELWFGKDKDGIVWLSVIAPNRPKIRFNFKVSDFHGIYKADGTQITEAEGSAWAAMAAINILKEVYSGMLVRVFENPPVRPAAGGRQSTQGKSPAAAKAPVTEISSDEPNPFSEDDDLPF